MQTTDAEVATAEQRILAAEQRAKAAGAAAAAEKAKVDAPKAAKALADVQKVNPLLWPYQLESIVLCRIG